MDGVITKSGLVYKFISTLLMLCHFKNLDGSYCHLFRTHLWMDPINGGPAKLSLMLLCENSAKYYISAVLGTITKKSIGAIPIPPNTGKYWPIPNTPIPVSFEP